MVGCLLVFFLVGLELFCLALGVGLPDSGASPLIYRLWSSALWSIPLTGFAALWVRSRHGAAKANLGLGGFATLVGATAVFYWGWQTIVNKMEVERFAGSLIACMALTPALLLLSAGLSLLFKPRVTPGATLSGQTDK